MPAQRLNRNALFVFAVAGLGAAACGGQVTGRDDNGLVVGSAGGQGGDRGTVGVSEAPPDTFPGNLDAAYGAPPPLGMGGAPYGSPPFIYRDGGQGGSGGAGGNQADAAITDGAAPSDGSLQGDSASSDSGS